MNVLEKILYMLKIQMETPKPYGWFHLIWIFLVVISILILLKLRKRYNDKQLKTVLAIYGIIAFVLELLKQLMWSFNYDVINNIVTWDYQWYAAPFQLCTTPIFVSMICLFLKDGKLRNSLLSFMAYVTILGGLVTILLPSSCFTKDILINIHTMWLHCGSFVVSVYLLASGAVKVNRESFKSAFKIFLIFVFIAEILNIGIYNLDVLNGETFNMFYISPYFITELPVFSWLQENLPFLLYLLTYILAIFIGSWFVYSFSYMFKMRKNSKKM